MESGDGPRKSLSAIVAVSTVFSTMILLAASVTTEPADPTQAKNLALSVHAPIIINGNGGFTNSSGVVWGSGMAFDPYVIADWDISASNSIGILVQSTDAHFVIRGCYVHDGETNEHDGIVVQNCVNALLENNQCTNNRNGIGLLSSTGNILVNNTCDSNHNWGIWLEASIGNTIMSNDCRLNGNCGMELHYSSDNNMTYNNVSSNLFLGIYLYSSINNVIIANNCSSSAWTAIWLASADNTRVIGNNCSSNIQEGTIGIISSSSNITMIDNYCCWNTFAGIELKGAIGNTLAGNVMIDDGILVRGNDMAAFNAHSIDASNTVNGKPIFYCKNQNGITVPPDTGQVILANCSDIMVDNEDLSHCTAGVQLAYCSKINVTNNDCSWNTQGISLYSSNNDSIVGNNCSSNVQYGVLLHSSSDNTLTNNFCSSNAIRGIFLEYSSSHNAIVNNRCWWNNNDGIGVLGGDNHTLIDNDCSWNLDYGIGLQSTGSILKHNNCSSNQDSGIYVAGTGNVLTWNQFYNNIAYGILISSGSSYNIVFNNTFVGNNGASQTYNALHIQAYDDGRYDRWNTSGIPHGYGNYWSDWTTPDVNHDGIVDQPYAIAGHAGNVSLNTSAKDYYPLELPALTFDLNLVKGWNLISVPLVGNGYKASTLGLMKNDVVISYDPMTRSYDKTFIVGISPSSFDFAIADSTGYWIYARMNETLGLHGGASAISQTRSINVPGGGGWAAICFNTLNATWRASMVPAMYTGGAITVVARYSTASGNITSYIIGVPPTDFTLVPGEGYWIYCTASGNLSYNP
jgi:parallel beta-helix repeat protein